MKFLSVCSGIEAASAAWHPLGWEAVAFAEIDAFPSAVLKHHYPSVPNWGDLTKFKDWPDATFDVLVGGTPCQSFSVAGLRKGLDDPRGNLALTYLAVLDRYRPTWCVWENVPGVLSSAGGRDFGAFLGGLGQLGYGFAYRVLDAQFFGVAQRRRRVFVVGNSRSWQRAAAVLFDAACLSGDPAPRRETREGFAPGVAGCLGGSSQTGGFRTTDLDNHGAFIPEVANPLTARMRKGINTTLDEGQTAIAFAEVADPVAANQARTYTREGSHNFRVSNVAHTTMTVRRLTPRECERLQGFPDDYTLVRYRGKPAADGPRYKALGNSMAVPCMAWIGRRLQFVHELIRKEHAA